MRNTSIPQIGVYSNTSLSDAHVTPCASFDNGKNFYTYDLRDGQWLLVRKERKP